MERPYLRQRVCSLLTIRYKFKFYSIYHNIVHTVHYVRIHFAFNKSTLNSPPFTHQDTLFDPHSDAFRRSSTSCSGSAIATVNFSARQTTVFSSCPTVRRRNAAFTRDTRFLKLHGGRLYDWPFKLRIHLSLQTHDFKVLSAHHNLYCRSSFAVVLRTAVV